MLRALIPCLLFCALSVLLLAQKHAGFMLYLLLPIMLVYLLLSAWRIRKQPQRLPELPLKMLLCLTSISAIAMVHMHYHQQARAQANRVVAAIIAYQQSHGAYPASLQAAHIQVTPSARIYYHLREQQPSLFYPTTFTPFETYDYQFDSQQWQHRAD